MQPLTMEEIIRAIGGEPPGDPPRCSVARVGADSRDVRAGELFFALRGERFDGHEYVKAALEQGAAAAVVSERELAARHPELASRLIFVSDTLAALGELGRYHREQIAATVIAVTGSNGKTTTKFMIDCVLAARRRGRAGVKSFNNAIGVPLTLLSAETGDEYLVVEIGTNAPGEVAALARLAKPDIAVVVSIGEEHLEFLGDLKRIAEEETSVLAHVRPGGLAVLHADAAALAGEAAASRLTRVTFGLDESADLRASAIEMTAGGLRFKVNERFDYELPVIGPHNASNALAAIAVGRRMGMEHDEIAAALRGFQPPPMRMNVVECGSITVINDAYNANPGSMAAGLATLDAWPGARRNVVILGEMFELGAEAERCHAAVGRAAAASKAQLVIAVGRFAGAVRDAVHAGATDKVVMVYPDAVSAGPALTELLRSGDVVLLKGSRAAGMERLLPMIQRAGGAAAGESPATRLQSKATPTAPRRRGRSTRTRSRAGRRA